MPPFTRFYLNIIKFLACPAGFPIVWFLPTSLVQFHPLTWFPWFLKPRYTDLIFVPAPVPSGYLSSPAICLHNPVGTTNFQKSWSFCEHICVERCVKKINYEVPIFQNIFSEVSFFLHWRVKLISAYFCVHVISRVYKLYENYPRSISSLSPFHSPLSLPVPLRFQSKPWSDRFMAIHLSVAFYTNNEEYQLGCA